MDDSLEAALVSFFNYQMADVYTALPAKIVRVQDADKYIVDAQPLINLKGFDDTDSPRPIVMGVPVVMPATAKSMVRLPIAEGDIVLLVYSQRDTDVFKSGDGSAQPPGSFRVFDKRDAIAIPGLFPFSLNPNSSRTLDSASTDLSLTHNIGLPTEVTIRLTEAGEIKVLAPLGMVSVEADQVNVTATTTMNFAAANVNFTGVITINGVPYLAHTHSGVTTGPDVSGPVVV